MQRGRVKLIVLRNAETCLVPGRRIRSPWASGAGMTSTRERRRDDDDPGARLARNAKIRRSRIALIPQNVSLSDSPVSGRTMYSR
jgi:hypothetical protein